VRAWGPQGNNPLAGNYNLNLIIPVIVSFIIASCSIFTIAYIMSHTFLSIYICTPITITFYPEKNNLQSWVLIKIVCRCPFIRSCKIPCQAFCPFRPLGPFGRGNGWAWRGIVKGQQGRFNRAYIGGDMKKIILKKDKYWIFTVEYNLLAISFFIW